MRDHLHGRERGHHGSAVDHDRSSAPGKSTLVEAEATGGGQPLPGDLAARFGASLGADLSGVRVHTDASAASSAASHGARAYAHGQDIFFGAGQYDPASSDGQQLIAHEVAHTVQQRGSSPLPQLKLKDVSAPSDAHEVEADRAANAMVAGTSFAVAATPVHVARRPIGAPVSSVAAPSAPHPTGTIGNVAGHWEYDNGLHYKVQTDAHLNNNKYGYHLVAETSGTAYKLSGNSGEYWYIYINDQPSALTGKGRFRIDAHGAGALSARYIGYAQGAPRAQGNSIYTSARWHLTSGSYVDMWLDVVGWISPHHDGGILGFVEEVASWFDSNVLEPIYNDIVKPFDDALRAITPYLQVALDVASLVAPPPWDIAASLANAMISAAQGDYASAALSAFAGAAKLTKLAEESALVRAGTATREQRTSWTTAKGGLEKIIKAVGTKEPELRVQLRSASDALAKVKQNYALAAKLHRNVVEFSNALSNLNTARDLANRYYHELTEHYYGG